MSKFFFHYFQPHGIVFQDQRDKPTLRRKSLLNIDRNNRLV